MRVETNEDVYGYLKRLYMRLRVNVIVSQTTGCLTRNKAGMEMKEWSLNPLLTENYLRPFRSPAHQNVSRDITSLSL
jgi:hypothetical protein